MELRRLGTLEQLSLAKDIHVSMFLQLWFGFDLSEEYDATQSVLLRNTYFMRSVAYIGGG